MSLTVQTEERDDMVVLSVGGELDMATAPQLQDQIGDLLERGLTTQATYVAQQTATRTAQSRLEQATAQLRLNEQQLGYTTLQANADGIITRTYAEIGAVVAPVVAGNTLVVVTRNGGVYGFVPQ